MKKIFKSVGSILLAGTLLLSAGCFFDKKDEKTYVVTFKQDGCEDISFQVLSGGSISNVPVPNNKEGYTIGWDKTDFSNITSDMVITAIAVPNEYKITYQLLDPMNNAIAGNATQKVTYDSSYELQELTCYGYTFKGWLNGTEEVASKGIWKIADDVTLTPYWANNYYTISFIQLDGTHQDIKVQNGDVLAEKDIPEIVAAVGYDVAWSITDFSKVFENTTVEVVKTAKTYKVTYDLADGEKIEGDANDIEETLSYNAAYTLKTPTKAGYTFQYWELEDGTPVPQEGNWAYAKDVTLTAVWTQNTNEITFMHWDGTTDTRYLKTGEALTDIPTPKAREGYRVAWEITDFSSVTKSITVNEEYFANNYQVTYSVPEDTSVDGETADVTYDASYNLAKPTRYGYTFVGWQYGDKLIAASGNEWKVADNAILTAKWQDNYYTITFNYTNKPQTTIIVEKGDTLSADKIPACEQKKGYTCVWSITDFSKVTEDQIVNVITTPNTYQVKYTFSSNEGTLPQGVAAEFKITYDTSYTLAVPTRSGDWKFAGWKDVNTGSIVNLNGTWTFDKDVTLVATWKESGDWTQNY